MTSFEIWGSCSESAVAFRILRDHQSSLSKVLRPSMTEREKVFNIVNKEDTPSEPDVLLFSPIDPFVLVAGTYHLESDGRRSGSLLVYVLDPSSFTW